LKNKETASFVLSNRTPFLQVVDDVFAPLQPIESSVKIAIFVGVLLGGIIASIMFSLSKVIRDALG
jgi:hypothetical protein